MNITPISQFISFEQYVEYVKYYIAQRKLYKAKRTMFNDNMETKISPVFVEYLKTLRSEGFIKPIENSKNRGNFFINSWNRFALEQEKEYDIDRIIRAVFGRLLSMSAVSFTLDFERKEQEPTEDDFRQEYEKFVTIATNGNFGMKKETLNDYFFQIESLNCEKTDDYLSFEIKNWNITLYKFEEEKRTFVPAEIPEEQGIEHRVIEFKTGNLLIADWFRIEAFTKEVKNQDKHKSVNSSLGRVQETDAHLKNNIIHISVGNTCPHIFRHEDKIVIGRHDYHEDDFETDEEFEDFIISTETPNEFDLGSVCTDLWWVTILEYETLIKILARSMTPKEAKLVADKYLEDTFNHTSLTIEPGEYHLYFCGNSEEKFDKMFDNSEIRKGKVKPFFTFSKTLLSYKGNE